MGAPAERSRARVHDDIVRASSRAHAPLELLARVARSVRSAVPYDGGGWLLADPATGLHTGVVPVNVDGALHLRLIESEIVDDDVNKFSALAHARVPVARLGATTGGDLSRSARHRKLYAPNGYGDELRAVFRTGDVVWGQVCLSRTAGQPAFTATESGLLHRIGAHVAEGLRTGHLLAAVSDGAPGAPGVLVVHDSGDLVSGTEEARELLASVPRVRGLELPMAVYEVAQRARALTEGRVTGPPPTARLAVPPEGWLVLHGSRLAADRSVVIVEPARRPQLAPVVVATHGLTAREREVTELWSQGLDVAAVARRLVISRHTVHDHVKAVYAKMGVRSRPELIATLYSGHAPTR